MEVVMKCSRNGHVFFHRAAASIGLWFHQWPTILYVGRRNHLAFLRNMDRLHVFAFLVQADSREMLFVVIFARKVALSEKTNQMATSFMLMMHTYSPQNQLCGSFRQWIRILRNSFEEFSNDRVGPCSYRTDDSGVDDLI